MKQLLLIIGIAGFLIFTQSVDAKVLPQSKSGVVKQTGLSGSTIYVSPRLRGDRRAVVVNFSGLQNATAVSYLLVYTQNGQMEAAQGGLNLSKSSLSQELLFGTCSKNVCRYHSGIKDARLEISYTSKNGKKYLKKFKIKI